MKRRAVTWLFVLPLLLVVAPATLAATFDQVATALARNGYYIEPGAEPVDERELNAVVQSSRTGLRAAVLAGNPPEGTQRLAEDLLNDLGSGTVVVVTPTDLGVSTSRAEDSAVDRALNTADEQADSVDDLPGHLAAFDSALAQEAEARGGVSLGALLFFGGLIVVGLMVLFSSLRTRKAARDQQERSLQEARQEVRGQVGNLADRILALSDQVSLAANDEASRLYTAATETYTKAQDHLERSSSVAELETVSDELDHARWQLESVTALLEGREPPPKPEREVSCFFDPNHGAGIEEATIDTSAGQQQVRVCSHCAAKLRAGETPEPRMIEVGGQRVPAAMAPRSYGGGGLGWLADFALILAGRRYTYGWGGYRGYGGWGYPRRRRWYAGGWGGPSPWGGWGGGQVRRGGPSPWGGWGGGSVSRGGGRSRSVSRGGGSRSRSVSRGGGSRSRSVSRGGGSRSRGGGRRR